MWLLIDGNNWYARDWYGSGVQAVGTFLRRLSDIRDDLRPERTAICWDSPSFRSQANPYYKAGRAPKPAGYHETLADLHSALAGVDSTSITIPGFEADDILATLALHAIDEGCRATICSADRDLHQSLVADAVNQITVVRRITPGRLTYDVITAQRLHAHFGVHPHQWVDYRSLVGDQSDNIAGCPGIGPKVAVSVLSRHGTLDAFYLRPFDAPITPAARQKLLNYRDALPTARRLIRLCNDVPLPATWLEGCPL